VSNLSPNHVAAITIARQFALTHNYTPNDFDAQVGHTGVPPEDDYAGLMLPDQGDPQWTWEAFRKDCPPVWMPPSGPLTGPRGGAYV
jgi:hypothetical protein